LKNQTANLELEAAHHRTLDSIAVFNQEIKKMHVVLESLTVIPERVKQLVMHYETLNAIPGGFKLHDFINRLEKIPTAIINTMEVVRFGLLDQIVLFDSRGNYSEGDATNHYFMNLTKAVKNIIKQAETMSDEAQNIQTSLQQIKDIFNYRQLAASVASPGSVQDNNEFKLLLAKLEWIMASLNR
jgi:hypothetical protein